LARQHAIDLPLSCNSLASDVEADQHCLLRSFEEARRLLEQGRFKTSNAQDL
jgi:hypothetical protein